MSDSGNRLVTMKLPYPLSANRYWRSIVLKDGRVAVLVSKEGRLYKEDIGWRVRAYGFNKPMPGRVIVGIQLYPARPQDADKRAAKDPMRWDDTVRCIDLDNARKVLLDAMKGIAFLDDNLIFADWGLRMEPDGEARAVVHIRPFSRGDDPQLPLGELF